jgi:hypothetical protein
VSVEVDDYFPCLNGQPVFSRSHGAETWVLILEKAWAKVHGSYKRIEAGLSDETFRDLLGAPAWTYDTKDENEDIFQMILDADRQNFIMGCGCSPETNEEKEEFTAMNLVTGHAYGLLDAYET